jgi:putative tributyrin esterase
MALIQCHFFSHSLGLASTMSVILPDPMPPGAATPRKGRVRPFPTLYLLHGLSDDHTIWQRRTSIERYVERLNLAVVMPAVQRSFYTNTITGQRYWTFVSEEVPWLARHFFPLSEAREENYVAGLSMGGYGAYKLALSYPERFAAAASLSGALEVVELPRWEETEGGRELKYIFGEVSSVAESVNDLGHLAAELVRRGDKQPRLYQWCGTEDGLYGNNVRFRDRLKGLGLTVTYEEGPGGHDWSCWDQQIQRVLTWLPLDERR